ncbi:mercuric transporter MerT family protein [Roseivivax marinus]|uniref:mercuric transporter MerT family protein n=1 Tax=Roseivivax marinus TaxID=1379903 RepID=UPI00273F5BAB|nr:mercuric transporter MerT family protein [Roseivivax marinus]
MTQTRSIDPPDTPGATHTRLAALTGLVGALGASSCCVLPLILVSLGVSGAWIGALTALEPLKPLFLTVAILALGWGFRRIYRRRVCVPGETCSRPMPDRLVKSALWLSTGLVAAALAWGWIAPVLAPVLLGL